MSRNNPLDNRAPVGDLKRRIYQVERQAPLGHSSVSGELKLLTPDNNPDRPGGSITAGGAKVSAADGGSFKVGAAGITADDGGKVGAGPTKIFADGSLRSDDDLIVVYSDLVDVRGRVDATDGVRVPYNGVMTEVGGALAAIDGAAGGRLDDIEARTGSLEGWKATVDAAFDAVRARLGSLEGWKSAVDGALDAIRGRLSTAEGSISTHGTRLGLIDTALEGKAGQKELEVAEGRIDAMRSKLNALIAAYNAKHPDDPASPMS